jgi:deazaflavin-dependent oxidoreductase (nitroreductase family)
MSISPSEYNAKIIEEFRANAGSVGGMLAGMPVLLLHHRGARSSAGYVSPLAYLRDGHRYVIFASAGGAPTNPGWYHNLKANPHVEIEVGTDTLDVTAEELTGEERDRLFDAQAQNVPQFAGYAQQTERVIPVIALTPAG